MVLGLSTLGQVLDVFEQNFLERGELGASISVWSNGVEMLSQGKGWCEREKQRSWTEKTLVPVYSGTKVPSATTLMMALVSRGLSVQTPVAEVWPEFPVPGALFCDLLSHQCGLAALDQAADVFDHEAVVAALQSQIPAWELGHGHGYHPRTFGALTEEPVRRLTGKSLGAYWREAIADPLELEFWIGLPEAEWSRVARLYPGKASRQDREESFYQQVTTEGTVTRRAFTSPRGLHSIQEMNNPQVWQAGLPAMGGIGTASALAKFYQAVIGAIDSPISEEIRQALATPVVSGDDRILLQPTAFTHGAQQDPLGLTGEKLRQVYGPSLKAFGHPGAGGSHGLGDPETGISFAYVMNQMDLSVMPGDKCMKMVGALFSEMA